jgi:hypothetical protein
MTLIAVSISHFGRYVNERGLHRKSCLCGARSQYLEEIGQGVDSNDLRIEFSSKNPCRCAGAAADADAGSR